MTVASTDFERETVSFDEVPWDVAFDGGSCKNSEEFLIEVEAPADFGRETMTFEETPSNVDCKGNEGCSSGVECPSDTRFLFPPDCSSCPDLEECKTVGILRTATFEEVPWAVAFDDGSCKSSEECGAEVEAPTDFGRETVTFEEVPWDVDCDSSCKSDEGCGSEVECPPDTHFLFFRYFCE